MGKGRNERGTVQQTHLFPIRVYNKSNESRHVCTARAIKSCTYTGKKAIQPTISKGVCTAQLLTQVLLKDTAPQHASKNNRKWKDLPFVAGEPSPALSSSGCAGPPHRRLRCASRPRLHQQAARRTTSAGPREGERDLVRTRGASTSGQEGRDRRA